MMTHPPSSTATRRGRLLGYVVRTTVAAVLAWLFLCAWDIWADPINPTHHRVVGQFHVAQAGVHPNSKPNEIATKDAILRSHLKSLKSAEVLQKAKERVRIAFPQLVPSKPSLQVSTTTQFGKHVIEISSLSSNPAYLQALINEVMSEHIVVRKREWNESAEGRAYGAVIQQVLESQKEVVNLKTRLRELEGKHEPDSVRASLQGQLAKAGERYNFARESLSRFPSEEGLFGILWLAQSEPYAHGMDPYSLVIHHPWRAVVSAVLAWFISVLLVPLRGAPMPRHLLPQSAQA